MGRSKVPLWIMVISKSAAAFSGAVSNSQQMFLNPHKDLSGSLINSRVKYTYNYDSFLICWTTDLRLSPIESIAIITIFETQFCESGAIFSSVPGDRHSSYAPLSP